MGTGHIYPKCERKERMENKENTKETNAANENVITLTDADGNTKQARIRQSDDLSAAVGNFMQKYVVSLDLRGMCADIYASYVCGGAEEERPARMLAFQQLVAKSGAGIYIRPVDWHLLYLTGVGVIAKELLGAAYSMHGLILYDLGLSVEKQREVYAKGYNVYVKNASGEIEHITRTLGDFGCTIAELRRVFKRGGVERTAEEQIAYDEEQTSVSRTRGTRVRRRTIAANETRVLTKEEVYRWLTTKPYPFTTAELCEIAAIVAVR